jgi:hypothetical protein
MNTCDGLVVEEATIDQWMVSAFLAAQRAVPKATCATTRPVSRAHAARQPVIGGARTLYWLWLVGALLALALH